MKIFYLLIIGILTIFSQATLASSFEPTSDDYTHVMHKVGMGAQAGTKTSFAKGPFQFEWTFDWAAVPVPSDAKIRLMEKNHDSTQMKFQVCFPVCLSGCSIELCEFTLQLLNGQSIDSTEENFPLNLGNVPAQPKLGSIEYFRDKFGSYPPPLLQQFKFEKLVVSTMDPLYGFEGDHPDNTPDKKQTCLLTIREGLLYRQDASLFTTDVAPKALNDYGLFIWVLSKKGKIYSTTSYGERGKWSIGNHHSFFLKSEGYGKPITAGGHIKAIEGKITELDNGSGHYKPNSDQLLLAAHYFYTQNILAENVAIQDTILQATYRFSDIAKINPLEILAKYKELD